MSDYDKYFCRIMVEYAYDYGYRLITTKGNYLIPFNFEILKSGERISIQKFLDIINDNDLKIEVINYTILCYCNQNINFIRDFHKVNFYKFRIIETGETEIHKYVYRNRLKYLSKLTRKFLSRFLIRKYWDDYLLFILNNLEFNRLCYLSN